VETGLVRAHASGIAVRASAPRDSEERKLSHRLGMFTNFSRFIYYFSLFFYPILLEDNLMYVRVVV